MLDLKGLFLVPIFVRLGEPCEARMLQAVGRANAQSHHGFRDGESTFPSGLARFYWDPDLLSAAWLREAAVLDALVPGRLCTVIYLAISMFRFLV